MKTLGRCLLASRLPASRIAASCRPPTPLLRRAASTSATAAADAAEDGTVQAIDGLRLPWEYVVTRRPVGDDVEVVLVRAGQRMSVSVQLVPEPRLVPLHDHVDAAPSCVCSELTPCLSRSRGDPESPTSSHHCPPFHPRHRRTLSPHLCRHRARYRVCTTAT